MYVPGLHNNLISVPKLIEKGFSLTMVKKKCLIESKQRLVMELKKSGSFYVTECLVVVKDSTTPETVNKDKRKLSFTSVADTTNLWHQRFGHLDTKAIVAMSKKEVDSFCTGCVLGKFGRNPFRSTGRQCSYPTKIWIWTSTVLWKLLLLQNSSTS
jgi:hypothetical protein